MKVLFLDFDGPLFPNRIIKFDPDNRLPYPGTVEMPPNEIVTYWKMEPLAVHMLNFLHEIHPFETVISSSWKRWVNKEQILDIFHVNGLKLDLHEGEYSTPDINRNTSYWSGYSANTRAKEIETWLINHGEVDDYLILDDPDSGSSLTDYDNHTLEKDRIVMVEPDTGIGTHHYNRLCDIVAHWAGVKRNINGYLNLQT